MAGLGATTPHIHTCPRCGSGVARILRTEQDKRLPHGHGLRRYRCKSTRCHWQGLLPRHGRREKRQHARQRRQLRRLMILASGAMLAMLAVLAVLAVQALGDG